MLKLGADGFFCVDELLGQSEEGAVQVRIDTQQVVLALGVQFGVLFCSLLDDAEAKLHPGVLWLAHIPA